MNLLIIYIMTFFITEPPSKMNLSQFRAFQQHIGPELLFQTLNATKDLSTFQVSTLPPRAELDIDVTNLLLHVADLSGIGHGYWLFAIRAIACLIFGHLETRWSVRSDLMGQRRCPRLCSSMDARQKNKERARVHGDGAPCFGQRRVWTFWFGSTRSMVQVRKAHAYLILFSGLGFVQHNSGFSWGGTDPEMPWFFNLKSGQGMRGRWPRFLCSHVCPKSNLWLQWTSTSLPLNQFRIGLVGSFLKDASCFGCYFHCFIYLPPVYNGNRSPSILWSLDDFSIKMTGFLRFGSHMFTCSLDQCLLVQIVYHFWQYIACFRRVFCQSRSGVLPLPCFA